MAKYDRVQITTKYAKEEIRKYINDTWSAVCNDEISKKFSSGMVWGFCLSYVRLGLIDREYASKCLLEFEKEMGGILYG